MIDDAYERRIGALLAQRGLQVAAGRARIQPRGHSHGPLGPGQQRIWVMNQILPGSNQYSVPMAWRIHGSLDERALVQSVEDLCRRHESLRTVFRVLGGEPEQVVRDDVLTVNFTDLTGLPAADRRPACESDIDTDIATPFDLEAGPPVRVRLYRLGDSDWTLFVNSHHIVMDEWSAGLVRTQLAELYRDRVAGIPARAADPPVQYLDWVAWAGERQRPAGADIDYWRHRLDGAPDEVGLPGNAQVSVPGPAAEQRVPVDQAALRRLTEIAREEGCTPFMALLAVWSAVLYRISGQDDLVIGTPFTQRRNTETHNLIGFFLNTLILRVSLAGDPAFRTVLQRVHATAAEAYAHADVPFDVVLRTVRPDLMGGSRPLTRVWFATEEDNTDELALSGAECTPVPLGGATAKFDIMLFASRGADTTDLVIEYDTAIFEPDVITRLADQLARLVEAVATSPGDRLSSFDLLSAQERERLLYEWNATAADLDAEPLLHGWFEKQAERTPEAIAAEHGDERITYAELDERADALAQVIRAAGVGPGDYVGIAMRRSVGMLVAVLATLKASVAYVALDVAHPRARLAFILEDARVSMLLADGATRDRLPAIDVPLVDVSAGDLPSSAAADGADPLPHQAAYVTYTSGSTGRPKGILMPHRAVSNLIAWQLRRYRPWRQGHRTLQFASLSFDVSAQEIFTTLATGGTLVLITDEERRDIHNLADLLVRYRIERLFIPAPALQQLAEGYAAGRQLPDRLDTVIAGSEQLTVTDELRRLFDDLPQARLHNEYGPSETHVATAYALPQDPSDWRDRAPIGTPVANCTVYVLDAHGHPVPAGMQGEIHIGGVGVAHGYLGRPSLTAEAFAPDPFSGVPGARLYRTGDIARYLGDGTIEFLGRADSQVKIRGFRVELDEVRQSLNRCAGVRSTFVTTNGKQAGERQLVGYVTTWPGTVLNPAELRESLRDELPEYMVPAAIIVLPQLPLTVNGKVDQRRLPNPVSIASESTEPDDPPRDDVEAAVAREFSEILGAGVGRNTDFFSLGGNSLLATRLLWAVEAKFSVALALRDFLRTPTVAGVAARVRDAQEAPSDRHAAPAPPAQGARQQLDAIFDEILGTPE